MFLKLDEIVKSKISPPLAGGEEGERERFFFDFLREH
jgi:hypothetical protein